MKPSRVISSAAYATGKTSFATDAPYTAATASRALPLPPVWTDVRPLLINVKETSGRVRASFVKMSLIFELSVRSLFMNFLRAGVLKKRSLTSIVVPTAAPVCSSPVTVPPANVSRKANSSSSVRVVIVKRETAAILGTASPRKPRELMENISSIVLILLVPCRIIHFFASSRLIPLPLSLTRIYVWPPSAISVSIAVAPASNAFSTISFITDAGRSTTSPAAILLAVASSSTWMIELT